MTAIKDLWNSRGIFTEYKDPGLAFWVEVSLQVPLPPSWPRIWAEGGNCDEQSLELSSISLHLSIPSLPMSHKVRGQKWATGER